MKKIRYQTELYHVYNYKLELRHLVSNQNFPKILADSISPKQMYQEYEEWQDIVQFFNQNVYYISWTAKNFQTNFEYDVLQ